MKTKTLKLTGRMLTHDQREELGRICDQMERQNSLDAQTPFVKEFLTCLGTILAYTDNTTTLWNDPAVQCAYQQAKQLHRAGEEAYHTARRRMGNIIKGTSK